MESIGKARKVVRRNFISVLGNGEKIEWKWYGKWDEKNPQKMLIRMEKYSNGIGIESGREIFSLG